MVFGVQGSVPGCGGCIGQHGMRKSDFPSRTFAGHDEVERPSRIEHCVSSIPEKGMHVGKQHGRSGIVKLGCHLAPMKGSRMCRVQHFGILGFSSRTRLAQSPGPIVALDGEPSRPLRQFFGRHYIVHLEGIFLAFPRPSSIAMVCVGKQIETVAAHRALEPILHDVG
jgi:hypothetical protein